VSAPAVICLEWAYLDLSCCWSDCDQGPAQRVVRPLQRAGAGV